MKLEFDDPYVEIKSFDHYQSEEEPNLVWQLSPVNTKKISSKPHEVVIDTILLRQYFAGVLLMAIALGLYFWDSYFVALTYEINNDITPYEVWLLKGIINFVLFIILSQFLDINVFKFNIQFNLSLDNEEILDSKAMKLGLITAFTGSLAFGLQAVAIKYIPASTSQLLVSCNSILILVSLPLVFSESFSSISKFDIYSTILLVVSISILMLGQLTQESDISNNLVGYACSVMSAIFITLSFILLRDLNKRLHYVYYCTYVAIGYLIGSLISYVVSVTAIDLTKLGVWDFSAILGAAFANSIFLLLTSLAHKYAKPSQLAPMWSMIVVLCLANKFILSIDSLNLTGIIGGALALVAFTMPIGSRLFTEDPTLTPKNQIQLFKRFSSF